MIKLDRLEILIGGECQEVSNEATVDSQPAQADMYIRRLAYLSFWKCQASILNPILSFETRIMSALGLS